MSRDTGARTRNPTRTLPVVSTGQTDERVERIWKRVGSQLEIAQPRLLAPALTPFAPWVLLVAIVVFVPAALALAFFVRRHLVTLSGSDVVVYDVSFWRMRVDQEVYRRPLGDPDMALDGARLTAGGRSYHLEPGWRDVGEQLVELNRAAIA